MSFSTSPVPLFIFSEKSGRVAAMCSLAAGGTLLGVVGAAPAQAQVFSPGLSTSAANPDIYFSSNGTASRSSFSGYQFLINQPSGSMPTVATADGSSEYVSNGACAAAEFTAGASISATLPGGDLYATSTAGETLATTAGWTYPGQGYLALETIAGSNATYGWASITLGADDTTTLNSFAFQSTPGASILAGATPNGSAAAPEPDAIALLALGASGLAALRLRRKVAAASAV